MLGETSTIQILLCFKGLFPLEWVFFPTGLCFRIQEEWNKYIVPSKNEPEKYKVSRTFSFLMNRMTSTRNKCKVIWDLGLYYYV